MRKNCPLITAVSGFTVLIIGIICAWYAFPKLIDSAIAEYIALKEGSMGYDTWQKQPFPLKFKIYFFQVVNPAEVQNGANPIVKEVGPYVYDEYREKVNVSVMEENDTLRYVLKKTYFFNKEDSGCRTEDDIVTVINAGLVGTALQVELMMPTAINIMNDAIPYMYPNTRDVFLRVKVRDILFEGIPIYCEDEEVEFICGAMQGVVPPTLKVVDGGKRFLFSMFAHLNGSDDGPYEVGRGFKNTTRGYLYSWKDLPYLEQWGDQYCNMINGSDSTIFPPIKGKLERLYTFAQDFCLSLYASYIEDTTKFGIPVKKYMSKPDSIEGNKQNECFCPVGKDDNENKFYKCPQSGLIDITPCLKAPILISYPHFLMADKNLLKYVTGLEPDAEKHASNAFIEPRTGTPVSGRKRIQMNIQMKKFEEFTLLNNVSEGVFPILWIEEGADISEEYINILKDNFAKIDMVDIFKWILILAGLLILVSSFIMVLYKERLLCFTKVGNADINVPNRGNQVHTAENIAEMQFNNTVVYPTLYPQVDNKNIHDGLSRRQQWNQAQAHGVWNIKM